MADWKLSSRAALLVGVWKERSGVGTDESVDGFGEGVLYWVGGEAGLFKGFGFSWFMGCSGRLGINSGSTWISSSISVAHWVLGWKSR